jgi:hypothetical protein
MRRCPREEKDTHVNIYDYQRPLGKIDDIPALRTAFISVYDAKSKEDMVRFGLLLGAHLLEITGCPPYAQVQNAFMAMRRWLDKTANYHEARNISFGGLHKEAQAENDPVKARFFRTMAQIACIPHCKYHAIWATDFAVTLINRIYPGDLCAVEKERRTQINLAKREATGCKI